MAELGVDHHALQELEHLTTSFGQLKQAQAKFKSCVDDTTEIDPRNTSSSPCCLLPPPHPLNPNSLPTFVQRDESNPAGFFADQPILIPLTSSLYVPGKLTDLENVVVDVGTGYYVQKVRLSGSVAAYLSVLLPFVPSLGLPQGRPVIAQGYIEILTSPRAT